MQRAESSAEAEYSACYQATRDLIFMRNLCEDMGFPLTGQLPLAVDNQAAVKMSYNHHPGGTSSTPRPASAPCKHHAHPELSRVRAGTTEDDRHSVWTAFASATRPSVDFFALERAFSSWLFTHVDAERLSRTSADHRGRSVCVGSA